MIWIHPDVIAAILAVTGLTSILYGIVSWCRGA